MHGVRHNPHEPRLHSRRNLQRTFSGCVPRRCPHVEFPASRSRIEMHRASLHVTWVQCSNKARVHVCQDSAGIRSLVRRIAAFETHPRGFSTTGRNQTGPTNDALSDPAIGLRLQKCRGVCDFRRYLCLMSVPVSSYLVEARCAMFKEIRLAFSRLCQMPNGFTGHGQFTNAWFGD